MSSFEANCKICEDSYTDETGKRKPKILTGCGHTICELCAVKIMSDSKIVCPFDRIVTEVPEGNISFLRKNFAVLELLEEAMWKEKVEKVLDNDKKPNESNEYLKELALKVPCDENKLHLAVLYCLKCETHLCKWCSIVIHSSSSLASHSQVRLTEKPEPLIYCPSHPHNVAELICKDPKCKDECQLMCYMCHQYGSHKGHTHELIDDEYNAVRAELKKSMTRLDEEISFCKEYFDDIEKSILTYSDTCDLVENRRNQIKKFSESLHKLADEFKENGEKNLNVFIGCQTKNLKEMRKTYGDKQGELINLQNRIKDVYNTTKTTVVQEHDLTISLIGEANFQFVSRPDNIEDFTNFKLTIPNMPKLPNVCFASAPPNTTQSKQITTKRKRIGLYIDEDYHGYKSLFIAQLEKWSTFHSINNGKNSIYLFGDVHILILQDLPDESTSIPNLTTWLIKFATESFDVSSAEKLHELTDFKYFDKVLVAISEELLEPQSPSEYSFQCAMSVDKRAIVTKWTRDIDDILTFLLD